MFEGDSPTTMPCAGATDSRSAKSRSEVGLLFSVLAARSFNRLVLLLVEISLLGLRQRLESLECKHRAPKKAIAYGSACRLFRIIGQVQQFCSIREVPTTSVLSSGSSDQHWVPVCINSFRELRQVLRVWCGAPAHRPHHGFTLSVLVPVIQRNGEEHRALGRLERGPPKPA